MASPKNSQEEKAAMTERARAGETMEHLSQVIKGVLSISWLIIACVVIHVWFWPSPWLIVCAVALVLLMGD